MIAIAVGAAAGALLRWGLSLWLNPLVEPLPLGTLSANLVGGYLIGIAVGLFANSELPPEWRLFVVTGLLGGLTTFSTFSAEVVAHLQAQSYGWAAALVVAHVAGSLVATFLGFVTYLTCVQR